MRFADALIPMSQYLQAVLDNDEVEEVTLRMIRPTVRMYIQQV